MLFCDRFPRIGPEGNGATQGGRSPTGVAPFPLSPFLKGMIFSFLFYWFADRYPRYNSFGVRYPKD